MIGIFCLGLKLDALLDTTPHLSRLGTELSSLCMSPQWLFYYYILLHYLNKTVLDNNPFPLNINTDNVCNETLYWSGIQFYEHKQKKNIV